MQTAGLIISGVLQIPAGAASGSLLSSDSSGNASWGTVVSLVGPQGSDKQVQYNASGQFRGNANFIFDYTNSRLGVGAGATTPHSTLHVGGSLALNRTNITTSSVVASTDNYIGINTSAASTLTLPSASGIAGRIYQFKDETGNNATFNTTIASLSGNIDGGSVYVINKNYGAISLISNGTDWFTAPAGPQGLSGTTGSQGSQGSQGNQGTTGSQGNQGSGIAAGSDTQVQWNNSGSFAGSANFVWSNGSSYLGVGAGAQSPNSTLNVGGSVAYNRTAPGAYPYTVVATDNYIAVDTASARTLTIPTAVGCTGRIYTFKDEVGSAFTNPFKINTTSSQTIDGLSSKTVNINYAGVSLISNGSNWFTCFQGPGYSTHSLVTDTYASSLTFDLSVSNEHTVILTGNPTLTVSNANIGQTFIIVLTQDGTGSRTVTWFTTIKWAGGTAPTLTTTANKTDVLTFLPYSSGNYYGFIAGQNL